MRSEVTGSFLDAVPAGGSQTQVVAFVQVQGGGDADAAASACANACATVRNAFMLSSLQMLVSS